MISTFEAGAKLRIMLAELISTQNNGEERKKERARGKERSGGTMEERAFDVCASSTQLARR